MKILFICSICLLLSGCADSVSLEHAMKMTNVGFWHGFWHGLIFPFAFIISLFSDSTIIYAIYNNGGWYNFGFFLGVGGSSSSLLTKNM